jgi:hypothetical protein
VDGCVEWSAYRDPDGYGRTTNGLLAHRVAYEREVGTIPPGMELDHLCRNRACVNVLHLEPVTHAENMRRRSEAMTHCKNGHPRTPENTYPRKSGPGRLCCRPCNREAVARYRERKNA